MTLIPRIQIRQQYAKIGMETERAVLDIKQPHAKLDIQAVPPRLGIRSPKGELSIDSSKAWSALGRGYHLETMHRIYDNAKDSVLQTIARIAQEGDQLAAIHISTNALADLAYARATTPYEISFAGPASNDNVDINYTANKPQIDVTPGRVLNQTQARKPEMDNRQGKLNIYMRQHYHVEIIPPEIDIKI